MKIGFAGPVSVELLGDLVDGVSALPPCYPFPMMAHLVREYVRQGYDVSVFALSDCVDVERTVRGEALTIHAVPARRRRAWTDLFASERLRLREAMEADRCDVIHAQWTYEYASAAIAAGVPHVVTAQDAMLNILKYMSPRSLPHWLAKAALSSCVVRRVRSLTVVSEYLREYYLRRGYRGVLPVIPNGVTDAVLDLRGRRKDGGGLVFASILNGWGPRKNGAGALRAFAEYRRGHPGSRLVMFGDGHGEQETGAAWARREGLADGVTFAGRTNHQEVIVRLRDEADVLLHPAREDACPVAVIEAMGASLPVVGGRNAGGVAELVGRGGILVDDVSDTRQLVAAMERLSSTETRLSCGDHGREQVRERHRISVVARAYLELLASAVAGNGARRTQES